MVLYLIETNDGRKLLDSDALSYEVLVKVLTEIKREQIKKHIKRIKTDKDELWEILDRNGNRIDKLRETKEIVINYVWDCHYHEIKPSTEETLELIREKGFFAKFLEISKDTIYL